MSERLFENVKRIAFRYCAKEHEISFPHLICRKCNPCEKQKNCKTRRNVFEPRAYISADGKHQRIERKEHVDRKTVNMHKIFDRKLCPSRKDQRNDRCRQTDRIKEIADNFRLRERMDSDHENIYTAKLQRKIFRCKIP